MRTHTQRSFFVLLHLLVLASLLVSIAPSVSQVAQAEPPAEPPPAEPTSTPFAEPAIVGGTPATLGEFPWQVALLFDDSGSYEQECGGSLIADAWVLTAAHCVVEEAGTIDPATIRVAAGSIDLTTITTDQHIAVDQIIPHPSYDYDNPDISYDIALLRLAEPVDTSNPNIATIDLLSVADEAMLAAPGMDSTVTGWGKITQGLMGDYSDVLLKVDVPIVSNQACQQAYAAAGDTGTIYDSQLCAGGEAGRDACVGDSGGPLVVADGGSFVQIGVVSTGLGCAIEGVPGIYTRVTSYQDWIAATMGEPSQPLPEPVLEIDHTTGSPGSSFVLTVTNTLSTTASFTITVNDAPLDVITVAAESSLPVVLETQAEMRADTYKVQAQASMPGTDEPLYSLPVEFVLSDDAPQRTASVPGAPVLTLPLTVDPLEPRELTMSHDSGQPGSTFVITGTFFPYATKFVEVTINDNLVETVPISPGGEFTLVLQTAADAYEGKYDVSIDVYAEDRFLEGEEDFFFLEADAPLHTDSVSGAPVIQVPADIPPESKLTISHDRGQPGSTFIITGTHFLTDTLLDVKVSKLFTSETIPTDVSVISSDADGSFTFVLATTPQAEPGFYVLRLYEAGSDASVPSPLASVAFSLAAEKPLRTDSLPDVPVIMLPVANDPPESSRMSISYEKGQPGSTFIITGTGFLPNRQFDIRLIDRITDIRTTPPGVSVISSDADGSFTFVLSTTSQIAASWYDLALYDEEGMLENSVMFFLDAAEPLRTDSLPDVPVITLQEAATSSSQVYLPLIVR